MAVRRVTLLISAPLALLLVVATAASASPTLTAPACVGYQGDAKTLPVQGSGFVPGSFVSLRYEAPRLGVPRSAGLITPDAAGAFSTTLVPPSTGAIRIKNADFTLSALDPLRPELYAAKLVKVTRVRTEVQPRKSTNPGRRVRLFATGFPTGARLYAHYARFHSNVASATVSLGRARGDCGEVRKRLALVPGRSVARGAWTVSVDTRPSYSPATTPQGTASLLVQRRPSRRR